MKCSKPLAVASLLLLGVTWSLSSCLTRVVQLELQPFQQIVVQASVSALLLAFFRIARKEWCVFAVPSRKAFTLLGIRAFAGAIGISFILYAYATAPLSHAAWLGTLPYAAVWGTVLNRERLCKGEAVFLLLAIIGAGLIIAPWSGPLSFGKGEYASIVGHSLLALAMVVGGNLVKETGQAAAHFWSAVGLCIVALPFSVWGEALPQLSAMRVLPFALVGGLLWAINSYLSLYGFSRLRAGVANGILCLEGVWVLLFAYLFFQEMPVGMALLGGALISVSAVFMSQRGLK